MPDPRVAVVVLSHDRADSVLAVVERLIALPERPAVIVVDNASSDRTVDRVRRRFPGVDVVALARNTGAAGRNHGVERARTPYVAFCDDDSWWAPGSLRRGADLLDGCERLALITARVLVGPAQREDPTCAIMRASPLQTPDGVPGHAVLGFLAGASMVRRQAFLAAGGFEARLFLGGEEKLLAVDLVTAGWTIAYLPEVVVHHHPRRRNARARERLLLRNGLWFAWLRRPAASALEETRRALQRVRRQPPLLAGLASAVLGIPWVLRARRVVPAGVEAALARLDEIAAAERRVPAASGPLAVSGAARGPRGNLPAPR